MQLNEIATLNLYLRQKLKVQFNTSSFSEMCGSHFQQQACCFNALNPFSNNKKKIQEFIPTKRVVGHSSLSCYVVQLISIVFFSFTHSMLLLILSFLSQSLVNHVVHKLNRNTLIINAELHATKRANEQTDKQQSCRRIVCWPAERL